jgi:hypothetical protein
MDTTLHAYWRETPSVFRIGAVNDLTAPITITDSANLSVSSADAVALVQILLANGQTLLNSDSPANYLASDINGDGVVCVADLVTLQRWLIGANVTVAECHV